MKVSGLPLRFPIGMGPNRLVDLSLAIGGHPHLDPAYGCMVLGHICGVSDALAINIYLLSYTEAHILRINVSTSYRQGLGCQEIQKVPVDHSDQQHGS